MSQKFDLSPHYGFIAVLVASVLWGTTGTAASFAPHLSPLAIGALAMGGGGLLQALLARKKIAKHLQGEIMKVIFVPDKLINLVVKP